MRTSLARQRLTGVLTGALLLFLVLPAAPASAHASLIATAPGPSSSVDSPKAIMLRFDHPTKPAPDGIVLSGPKGKVAGVNAVSADDVTVRAALPSMLAPGAYTVAWRCLGKDGHVLEGTFTFTVKTARATEVAPVAAPAAAARIVAAPAAPRASAVAVASAVAPAVDPTLLAEARAVVAAGRSAATKAAIPQLAVSKPAAAELAAPTNVASQGPGLTLSVGFGLAALLAVIALGMSLRNPLPVEPAPAEVHPT